MLNSIVIPLDGSQLSESALPVASQLARTTGTSVVLLTSGWGSTVEELDSYLRTQAVRIEAPTTTSVVPDTFPATAIAQSLDAAGAVVMATHGRSGIGKALLGSVAEDVVKATDQPVVLVGPSAGNSPDLRGGSMVLPTDGSATAASVVDRAAEWADALEMKVHVVAVRTAQGAPAGRSDATDADVDAAVTAVADQLRAIGLVVTEETLIGKDPARSIVELAERLPAALIAMSTHARVGLARTALGSTAIKVVHDAPCPVLVQTPSD
jgi:nucleotide-binding universal stress UspA family protein